jgi:ribosomal protein L11 methyltransferase
MPASPELVLRVSYPSGRRELEDRVERMLFLSMSAGSTIEEEAGNTVVSLWFHSAADRDEAAAMLHEGDGIDVRLEERERVDWLDYYEHSLEPIPVGRRWVVVPDARLIADSTRTALIVPQERAFGTGSHETTALCLEMLETCEVAGKHTADIGTGSGILAMALAKLEAGLVVAVDNDPETWGMVEANLARNGIERERVKLFFGTVDAISVMTTFDLVVMNIIPEVILPALPRIRRLLVGGGEIIFSGVLLERGPEVIDRCEQEGLTLVQTLEKGEWWCGRFRSAGSVVLS